MSTTSGLTVTPLDTRCVPAVLLVKNTDWNLENPSANSFPAVMATAAATPGVDEIRLDYVALNSTTPQFTVPLDQTLNVPEGVKLDLGGGNVYAKFTGFRPFKFTHSAPNPPIPMSIESSMQSEIYGGVFHGCDVRAATGEHPSARKGGALILMDGELRVFNTRFTENMAEQGGAVYVDSGAKLVLDGDTTKPTADPTGHPEQAARTITLFKLNTASDGGGALRSKGEVELKRVWFALNNSNEEGGAIYSFDNTPNSTGCKLTTVSPMVNGVPINPDVQFIANRARLAGGAINHNSDGTSTLRNVVFVLNLTDEDGGALALADGTVETYSCHFEGNLARNDNHPLAESGNGGAVAVRAGTYGDHSSLFKQNRAYLNGGALWVKGGDATLDGSKFDTNFADIPFPVPYGDPPVPKGKHGFGHAIYVTNPDPDSTSTVFADHVIFNLNGDQGGTAARAASGGIFKSWWCDFKNNNGVERETGGQHVTDHCNPNTGLLFDNEV